MTETPNPIPMRLRLSGNGTGRDTILTDAETGRAVGSPMRISLSIEAGQKMPLVTVEFALVQMDMTVPTEDVTFHVREYRESAFGSGLFQAAYRLATPAEKKAILTGTALPPKNVEAREEVANAHP